MTSLMAWLDSTPEEQRAARELIALFSEQESRDELGVGQIRDAFSDLLFPGTSVLQTRARYYLFIPWCYTTGSAASVTGPANAERGRGQERQLIIALKDSPSTDKAGLIGARAGVHVQNLPSQLFWNGMLTYRIRTYAGDIGSLTSGLGATDGATEMASRVATEWNQTIPGPPDGFPANVSNGFAMSYDEASWLRERIIATTEGTLLAHLLEQDDPIDSNALAPWEAADENNFCPLPHARLFSGVMHGAALLYNLLLAQRHAQLGLEKDGADLVNEYIDRVQIWVEDFLDLSRDEIARWELPQMWDVVRSANPNVPSLTRQFVEDWVATVRRGTDILTDERARRLIEKREKRKRTQSRLLNDKLLAMWSGASGTRPLTYRWGNVQNIVTDIKRGLDAGS